MSALPDEDWQDFAACKGKPLAWFYPEKNRASYVGASRAILVCMGCPVRRDCLEYAITPRPRLKQVGGGAPVMVRYEIEREGIWGGTLPHQRRKGTLETILVTSRAKAEDRGIIPKGGRD